VSRPLTRQRRIGSTARAVVLQAPRSILITERSPRQARTVTVAIDGSAAGRQALTTAISLMRENGELNVLLYAPEGENDELRANVEEWLARRGLVAQGYYVVTGTDVESVLKAVEMAPCDLLIVGGDALPTTAEDSQDLAEELSCSLLVVR
jgi:nucleotide-binding universal stress UspA family protein